jgi:hypothetical protein
MNGLNVNSWAIVDGTVTVCSRAHLSLFLVSWLFGSTNNAYFKLLTVYSWPQNTSFNNNNKYKIRIISSLLI